MDLADDYESMLLKAVRFVPERDRDDAFAYAASRLHACGNAPSLVDIKDVCSSVIQMFAGRT